MQILLLVILLFGCTSNTPTTNKSRLRDFYCKDKYYRARYGASGACKK